MLIFLHKACFFIEKFTFSIGNKLKHGFLKQNIFVFFTNAPHNFTTNFFVTGVRNKKCHFQCAFDDNISATYFFTKQICKESTPLSLSPCTDRKGMGNSVIYML
jgi:hypothetical protein